MPCLSSVEALALLSGLPSLDRPILFWDGQASLATLAYAPSEWVRCYTLDELQSFIARLPHLSASGASTATWSGFCAGWAGYFSYEAGHTLVTGQHRCPDQPLAEFGYYRHSLRIELDASLLASLGVERQPPKAANWQSGWSFERYQQAFDKVQHYLKAGDCYQVNLAMPFSLPQDLRTRSPLPLLASFNPSYGGYLNTSARAITSVSPERFMAISGERMETRPIKGTVARSKEASEDARNKAWLAASTKNRAENLMIVDLLRNDLSRFALPHSVTVDKLFALETHANVHHLVSTISAHKQPKVTMSQVISGALPGGSITGAPKKRAMEIINELEVEPRGAYCGVMGYFDDGGYADFNILIRSIEATAQQARCWAGGGLVVDSTCQEEWDELHTKVAKILREW